MVDSYRKLKHAFMPESEAGGAARKQPIQLPTEDPYNKSVSENEPSSPVAPVSPQPITPTSPVKPPR